MMAFLGFLLAVGLFLHYKRRLRYYRGRYELEEEEDTPTGSAARWHDQWHRHWADKFERQARCRTPEIEHRVRRKLDRVEARLEAALGDDPSREQRVLRRARRRAGAEAAFYTHLMSYLGVMAFLALTNLMYPWFVWPALGWGIGLFAHYMTVFGSRLIRERYFVPAIEREVRREKLAAHTEKRASIDELSATIAHEIRNPIAAAKSLVQQMGEDPASVENVEYGRVALDELDRVERRISHLLKYAKEEDYSFANVNLAAIVDASLTQMKSKLDAAAVQVTRNYIGGPMVFADPEKLRQVFSNILDKTRPTRSRPAATRAAWTYSSRTAAAARQCDFAITGLASPLTASIVSSTPSSPRRNTAPASAWRFQKRSSRPTKAASTSSANPVAARNSSSACRCRHEHHGKRDRHARPDPGRRRREGDARRPARAPAQRGL